MQTVKARHYRKGRIAPIRAVIIHDMEAPEGPLTAENVANYFATTSTVASAHINVDNNSAVRSVPDADTAFAAPGANADGLQLEIAGYMRQTRAQWLDDYSKAALGQAARVVADWCRTYNIPPVRLTRAELKAGSKGISCHVDVSAVYKRSDHTDPGSGFPWDYLLAEVRNQLGATVPPVAMADAPEWPGRYFVVKSPPMVGKDITAWKRQMRTRGWTITVTTAYTAADADVTRRFQGEKGLVVDGIVGPNTWNSAWNAPIT